MIPIYRYEKNFGVDKKLMLREALSLEDQAYSESNESLLRKLPMSDIVTPRLRDFLDKFTEEFHHTDLGVLKGFYFYAYKDKDLDWHTDTEYNTGAKSFVCSFNMLLSGVENEVEFENYGKFQYKQALLNTDHRHRIKPFSNRIIARVAFKDYTYEEIVRKIQEKN